MMNGFFNNDESRFEEKYVEIMKEKQRVNLRKMIKTGHFSVACKV